MAHSLRVLVSGILRPLWKHDGECVLSLPTKKRYPIDSEDVVARCARDHIVEIKKCDDKVYGVTITGVKWKEVSDALHRKALEELQKKENDTKKKEEDKALDF